ncbi:MAG: hypothetical protein C4523_07710 [Myxococcales bacterium]|nr:MAG: hypothetical protein C4523_07710 [Myxococcales bacterium]
MARRAVVYPALQGGRNALSRRPRPRTRRRRERSPGRAERRAAGRENRIPESVPDRPKPGRGKEAMMRRKILTVGVVLFVALGLAACAHGEKRPDWTRGQFEKDYPNFRCMVGAGEAGDMQTAKDRARTEIAKQFSVKVEQLVQTLQDYTGMEGRRGENWILKTTMSELTRTYTDETIAGIEIRESWVDPESGVCHALAVLERPKAAMRLEQRVIELDFEIKKLLKWSRESGDKFSKVRPLVKALEMVKEREIKNSQLAVVGPSGEGIGPEVSAAELNDELNRVLAALVVAVQVEGDAALAGRVREAIVRSLGSGRISVQPDASGAELLFRGEVEGKETNEANDTGFVFAKIRASVELVNQVDGKTFGVIEHELRDGAKTWDDALNKTLDRLVEKIVAEFNVKLYDFLSL